MTKALSTFELQSGIVAAARDSGRPILDAGRGQPNWIALEPRAALFTLGHFAAAEALEASPSPEWGTLPDHVGVAKRLIDSVSGQQGGALLAEAIEYCGREFDYDPDAFVHELLRGVLGVGYPAPPRMMTHIERIMQRYLLTVIGTPHAPSGTYHIFGTEGGAAGMAYLFRSLRENSLLGPGDKIAMATPVFTPYLQIPVLAGFGFDVVELAAEGGAHRFGEEILDGLRDPSIKAFFIINPGNPDSRALPPARLAQLRELVTNDRPDLIIVADTVYATFVEGFRGTMTELPRNVITLHSFSKNFGATGTRVGFIAVHHDNVLDELLAAQDDATRAAQQLRYGSMTSDVTKLRFIDRLVADSREVALHNIAGLATPGQVQMALFALDYLLPRGRAYIEATRAELASRLDSLIRPLGIPAEGGQDSFYYALIDLLEVAEAQRGAEFAQQLKEKTRPEDVAMRLASEHGVVVLPGVLFGAANWEVRISLASLDAEQLQAVGEAIVSVLTSA